MTHSECSTCAIRHRALCGALDAEELQHLNGIARHKHLVAGEPILTHLDSSISFASIVSGVVKLTKSLQDGRTQIVGLQFASDFIGRPFQNEANYDAEAATDVQLCSFERAAFEKLLVRFPELQQQLLKFTLDELDSSRDWMLLLGRKTAREKIATFLAMVGRRSLVDGCSAADQLNFAKFDMPLTRTDIADLLGLTMETVSRQLSKLKNEGIIHLESGRRISILDLQKLDQIADNL
jgi:CRP/FNR family transcriptional regulator, anaerobic regulatory protein